MSGTAGPSPGRRRRTGALVRRRLTVLSVVAIGAVGLTGCSGSSSSSPTTGATATTAPPATAGPLTTGASGAGLCADEAALATDVQDFVTAQQGSGGTTGSLAALQAAARRAKQAVDTTAPTLTADLAGAPSIVQSAWSSLQPQLDQLFASALGATDVAGFARSAAAVESSNAFTSANATLRAYAQGTCPATVGG